MPNDLPLWNSLEVAKLAVSTISPILVAVIGLAIHRSLKHLEQRHWSSQTLTEWKLRSYEELAPHMNTLMCYLCYIGDWKRWTPPQILSTKRELDRNLAILRPILSPNFFETYLRFTQLCFREERGLRKDAGLRTGTESRRKAIEENGEEWPKAWDELFTDASEKSDRKKIIAEYECLIEIFASDLGLYIETAPASREYVKLPPQGSGSERLGEPVHDDVLKTE